MRSLSVRLRSQVLESTGSQVWSEITRMEDLNPARVAFLLCDVWDTHWCRAAASRCDVIANQLAPVVDRMRKAGVRIIHAPSDCMKYYEGAPQRERMQQLTEFRLPEPRPIPDVPLPIDDSDGGCDDTPPCPVASVWSRQHPAISITAEDVISDSGREVYSLLRTEERDHLFIAGVHTNMCVLHRSFGIKQMSRWGLQCVLIRDLTDSLYNPRMRPFVSHEEGTRLVVEYIERYWAPTTLSRDIVERTLVAGNSPSGV